MMDTKICLETVEVVVETRQPPAASPLEQASAKVPLWIAIPLGMIRG
jgi:hypothetical protein